jgi:hypothetical protein
MPPLAAFDDTGSSVFEAYCLQVVVTKLHWLYRGKSMGICIGCIHRSVAPCVDSHSDNGNGGSGSSVMTRLHGLSKCKSTGICASRSEQCIVGCIYCYGALVLVATVAAAMIVMATMAAAVMQAVALLRQADVR